MDGNLCCGDNCIKQNLIKRIPTAGKRIVIIFDYNTDIKNCGCNSNEFIIYKNKYIIKAGGFESVYVDDNTDIYPPSLITALGLIYDIYKEETVKHLPKCFDDYNIDMALKYISKNEISRISDIKSFFSSAAFLMGISGEEMMKSAILHTKDIKGEYEFNIRFANKMFICGTKDIILGLLSDIKKAERASIMAAKFYKSIIDACVFICKDLREMHAIGKVYLAGRMFDEDENLRFLDHELKRNGFEVANNFSVTGIKID